MDNVINKYKLLSNTAKSQVLDFIDALLSKEKSETTTSKISYRDKLLKVSQWSDSDIKVYEKNAVLLNNWKAEEW
ncbi:MAG: hypothetical protein WD048_13995 [Chitinophagales bacterium]